MEQKPLINDAFNIDLLIPSKGMFKTRYGLGEVTSRSVFKPSTNEFEPTGLYSTEIFGPIGDLRRLTRPGYIDLGLPIIHPLIYRLLIRKERKLENIISGRVYAYFSQSEGRFLTNEELPAGHNYKLQTGFSFFIKHADKLKFNNVASDKIKANIELIKLYCNEGSLFSDFLIIPAGLRDYTVDAKGSPSVDEINDIYSEILGISSVLKKINVNLEGMEQFLDPRRYKLQLAVVKVYEYIKSLIDGKEKFIQRKWASRSIDYATSNVITATPVTQFKLDQDPNTIIGFNNTVVGLYQYLKALGPIVQNKVYEKFLNHIFTQDSVNVRLIDPKTMKRSEVTMTNNMKKNWVTIENVTNKLGQDVIKNAYVTIDGYYPCIVLDKGNEVNVYFDPNELPEEYSLNNPDNLKKFHTVVESKNYNYFPVRPITYVELFMLSICDCVPLYPALTSRYPIINGGSIYPTMPYVKSTIQGRTVKYNIGNISEGICYEYPILGLGYLRSLSVHSTHLAKLDGDHDGDVLSFILLFSEESRKEVSDLLNSKGFYLDALGNFEYSVSTNVLNAVIGQLSE